MLAVPWILTSIGTLFLEEDGLTHILQLLESWDCRLKFVNKKLVLHFCVVFCSVGTETMWLKDLPFSSSC
jgi:hypothetical protein